ncbi:uncharacterized protein STEHIDRAFT_170314 [Stereum hirsutum FP-91666 SS1]|uniref:uncharacterized protein n=1 Tax=Stereum hirsutum (strain FP-91666) TaxID=721885 RepID=UPI000444938F|nr:uncharacterized protein STEHIDRAFT_170314 [Stereum hirsutum FP-91666 SS1]EIM83851.1 hypothetical protein STEHIDRAFT_170314 [Stereum hirsutum FP-91666 SS1]
MLHNLGTVQDLRGRNLEAVGDAIVEEIKVVTSNTGRTSSQTRPRSGNLASSSAHYKFDPPKMNDTFKAHGTQSAGDVDDACRQADFDVGTNDDTGCSPLLLRGAHGTAGNK